MTASVQRATSDAWARLERLPGLRTLGSAPFQRLIGLLLLGAGLLYLVVLLLAVDRAGGFQIDFVAAYRRASLDLLAGRSPYLPEQLEHAFPANGRYGWYLYPPAFAQVLTPLALLPAAVGAVAWLVLQAGMLLVATWMAASAAGARATIDRLLWTAVAVSFFLPVHEVLWTGNMGGPLALSVGALLAVRQSAPRDGPRPLAAGLLAGAIAVFKLSPLAWLPALVRAGGGLARGSLLAVGGLVLASVALAPRAWSDYARVLTNLVAGDVRYPNNLAPAIVSLNLGLPAPVADGIRVAAVVLAVVLVVASIRVARAQRGWAAAVACAVLAGLLVPAALWYHYLVLLLPLAAFVWVGGAIQTRVALLVSGALISAGMTIPLLAAAGSAALAATILVESWPAGRRMDARGA